LAILRIDFTADVVPPDFPWIFLHKRKKPLPGVKTGEGLLYSAT
jgi:hypothetical protein